MGCPCMTPLILGFAGLVTYLIYTLLKERSVQKKLERWSNTPKDLVILHGFSPSNTLPTSSPFLLKIQTYLRMAEIPYQMDTKDWSGPKGKAPWISINGQHVSDSEFIIEFINKKFEKNLNKSYSDTQIAVATSLRIMLDEHFFWGVSMERKVFGGYDRLRKVTNTSLPVCIYLKYYTLKRAKAQGIGLHSQREIIQIMTKDLQIISKVLGNNKYICGDEPCELDAGIFAQLAQCLWATPDSQYEKLINGEELKNLKEYCLRMKEMFWKDWDQCLSKLF